MVVSRKCCKAFSGFFEKPLTTAEPQTNRGGKKPLVQQSIQGQETKETSPIRYSSDGFYSLSPSPSLKCHKPTKDLGATIAATWGCYIQPSRSLENQNLLADISVPYSSLDILQVHLRACREVRDIAPLQKPVSVGASAQPHAGLPPWVSWRWLSRFQGPQDSARACLQPLESLSQPS